jgi:hypothetical protein
MLLGSIVGLALAAIAVLLCDLRYQTRQADRSREFQRLVCGLGLGPATDLSQCEFSFDPRLEPTCGADCGPIPGGVYFCPQHACSVFFLRPEGPAHWQRKEACDAEVP